MASKVESTVRNHPLVDEVTDERNQDAGIWAYLINGHCNGEYSQCTTGACVHVVHEDTWSEVARELRKAKRCTCEDCNPHT